MDSQETTAQNELLYNKKLTLIKRFAFYLSGLSAIFIMLYCYPAHADFASSVIVTLLITGNLYLLTFSLIIHCLVPKQVLNKYYNKLISNEFDSISSRNDCLTSFDSYSNTSISNDNEKYFNPAHPLYLIYNPSSHK